MLVLINAMQNVIIIPSYYDYIDLVNIPLYGAMPCCFRQRIRLPQNCIHLTNSALTATSRPPKTGFSTAQQLGIS